MYEHVFGSVEWACVFFVETVRIVLMQKCYAWSSTTRTLPTGSTVWIMHITRCGLLIRKILVIPLHPRLPSSVSPSLCPSLLRGSYHFGFDQYGFVLFSSLATSSRQWSSSRTPLYNIGGAWVQP
jgi:hypothetical protein